MLGLHPQCYVKMADVAVSSPMLTSGIRPRQKERKHYTEDCINDEEIEGKRMFSVEEKLVSDLYNGNFVREMKGEEVCLKHFQENGFSYPIVIKDKAGLGMRLPSKNFTVNDVRQCVGSRRVLDVMDVTTQKDIEMSMKDWVKYYENPQRDKLLNVISLEFSHTKLENYIESPKLVREIDWVDNVWPTHLKQSQIESTNIIDDMKYPKVQKYCLMSVKGCYTDFHIDFGGTSVWYHILHGRKVFWLIPPTETNVQLYEQWVLSGKQSDVFFGDTVDECGRIELEDGWTFFIPTGWIHAVYTPRDSLVFGGNFLHSFGIEKQLRIAQVEDITHVPNKFRYPFYTEMLWYVLARYADCLNGKSHVKDVDELQAIKDKDEQEAESSRENGASESPHPLHNNLPGNPAHPRIPGSEVAPPADNDGRTISQILRLERDVQKDVEGKENRWSPMIGICSPFEERLDGSPTSVKPVLEQDNEEAANPGKKHVHLTKFELRGLRAIHYWLTNLPLNKRNVPELIKDPNLLLGDVKLLLEQHYNDDPALAVTGKPVLSWPLVSKRPKPVKPKTYSVSYKSTSTKSGGGSSSSKSNSNARRRRTRCKKCEACLRADCGDCHFCKDMKKFGGPGRMKQSCISRQCMAPVLPHTACCILCGKDGWEKGIEASEEEASSLMECSICWEIVHPECLEKAAAMRDDGSVCDDLPNSWECPKCCQTSNGKNGPIPKLRQIRPFKLKSVDGAPATVPPDPGSSHPPHVRRHKEFGSAEDEMPSRLDEAPMLPFEGPLKRKDFPFVGKTSLKKVKTSQDDGETFTLQDSDSDEEQPQFHKLLPRNHVRKDKKKELEQKKRKMVADSLKLRLDGESHIRSCIRTSPLTPFHVLQTPGKDGHSLGEDIQKYTPLKPLDGVAKLHKLPQNLNGSLSPEEKPSIRSLINCHVKVLKCDEPTVPCNQKRSMPPSPTLSPLNNLQRRNGTKLRSPLKGKSLRKPICVVRPAPILDTRGSQEVPSSLNSNLALEQQCMLPVFRYLKASDLCSCMLVCKAWNMWCLDRRLWGRIDLAHKKIAAQQLAGIVRRQPAYLGLGWTNISKKLLAWLISRLPQLRSLDMSGCSWASVMALATCNCPTLQSLDLKWVEGMNDAHLRELLSPPPDSRPGLLESKSRLRNLVDLKLSGCDISDIALRYVTQHLRMLCKLNLSQCTKISDAGIALLTGVGSPTKDTLTQLDVSGCRRLTDNCLEHLRRCALLVFVDLRNCPEVSVTACRKFIAQSKQPLLMGENKLIDQQVNYLHRPSLQLV